MCGLIVNSCSRESKDRERGTLRNTIEMPIGVGNDTTVQASQWNTWSRSETHLQSTAHSAVSHSIAPSTIFDSMLADSTRRNTNTSSHPSRQHLRDQSEPTRVLPTRPGPPRQTPPPQASQTLAYCEIANPPHHHHTPRYKRPTTHPSHQPPQRGNPGFHQGSA